MCVCLFFGKGAWKSIHLQYATTVLLLRNRQVIHTGLQSTNVYLPCLSGNSPTSSGNLDQSAGSMNPHLPGAQDKISRPSQAEQDWRHEITFGVFHSLLSCQAQRQKHVKVKVILNNKNNKTKNKCRSFTRCTLLFTIVLRHQLCWCAVLLQSPALGCETDSLTRSKRRVQMHWWCARVGQTM